MVLYTLIVRLSDGMPLMASTDATPEIYKNQAKAITKKLHLKSPSRMSVESGPVSFNYIIEEGIVFLTMSDASYPRKLAFAFLADVYKHFVEELQHEFGDKLVSESNLFNEPTKFARYSYIAVGECKYQQLRDPMHFYDSVCQPIACIMSILCLMHSKPCILLFVCRSCCTKNKT